mmetsp:Transcript_8329/g.17834  ORF Transcript_8329/g.17834 Transcript_8329/m.17834 type:complete len:843 (+) Transcript_8329:133-2661(+)
MPRFGLSFQDAPLMSPPPSREPAGPSFSTPSFHGRSSPSSASPATGTNPARAKDQQTGVRLSCLSPGGKQWHSIVFKDGKYVLLSRVVEEAGDMVQQSSSETIPFLIETVLPKVFQRSFGIDAPIELLCVEAEGKEFTRINERQNDSRIGMPRLCVYSQKAVFLLQAAFDPETLLPDTPAAKGEIVSVKEPFEQFLLQSDYSTCVVRVRAAPQRWLGQPIHSPAGCVMMLSWDRSNNEFHLATLESNGSVKDPTFSFGQENVLGSQERIVDFCFGQSSGLSLLSSISILLLKANGNILAASPFVFDGSLVPTAKLQETKDFLETELSKLDRTDPKWRQCRAAQQYLSDVFPMSDRRTHFVTAKTISRSRRETAAAWPIRLQGPILFHSDDSDGSSDPEALSIETFGSSDLVGFAVIAQQGKVDIGVTSPTTVLPRFALESRNDTFAIDDEVFHYSTWVEKIDLGLEDSGAIPTSLCSDRNFDSILHVLTSTVVASISSNCVRDASLQVRGVRSAMDRTSTAWSCLEQPSLDSNIQGMVTISDDVAGHKLLVQLSDGSFQEINVSEEKASHELEMAKGKNPTALALLEAPSTPQSRQANMTLRAMEATPPFHEAVAPLIEKINAGLRSMGKIVDSNTSYDKISSDKLAVVASIQKRCENDVVVPLVGLAEVVKTRRAALQTMLQQQTQQVHKLMEMKKELETRNAAIRKSLETAETNLTNLRHRITAAGEASKYLAPTMTVAEVEFGRFMDQMEAKAEKWEKRVAELTATVRQQCKSMKGTVAPTDSVDYEMVGDLRKVSADTERRLKNTRQDLKETELKLHAVLRKAGLEAPNENVPSNINL